ncbi:unnamed protein product [Cochlearia groenlandica]
MDCYTGRNFQELVVPNYQESSSSETYPSSNMWCGSWTMNTHEPTEKCFDYNNITFNGDGILYNQIGLRKSEEEEEEEDEESKSSKAFYGASSLHDFQGIEHMDDIFLSSILEGNDEDVHRASSSNNSVGLGSSSMYGGSEVHMFHCHDMPLKEEAPFTISDMCEENMLDSSHYCIDLSSEELVLQDLQSASEKLTDETRKCFRDTFYRLARSSIEKLSGSVSANNSEESHMQTSRYDYCDGNMLSREEEEIESETNSIDRAVANLTFNKMESNISNFPLPERVQ